MPRWQQQATALKTQIEDLGRRLAQEAQQHGHWRLALVALEFLPLSEKLGRTEQLLTAPVRMAPLSPLPPAGLAA